MQRKQTLLRQSFAIMLQHKHLFVLPLCSTVACLILLSLALIPIHHFEELHQPITHMELLHVAWLYLLFLLVLFFAHQIIFFFNATLTDNLNHQLQNVPTALNKSFNVAALRSWKLYLWNCFGATVGIVLMLFHAQSRKNKTITTLLSKQHWLIASYFVIPIIVIQNLGPIAALKKSGQLISDNWGVVIKPAFSYALLVIGARLIAFIPLVIALYVGGKINIFIGSFMTVFLMMLISMVNTSTRSILSLVLYLFADEKLVTSGFNEKDLRGAFFVEQ